MPQHMPYVVSRRQCCAAWAVREGRCGRAACHYSHTCGMFRCGVAWRGAARTRTQGVVATYPRALLLKQVQSRLPAFAARGSRWRAPVIEGHWNSALTSAFSQQPQPTGPRIRKKGSRRRGAKIKVRETRGGEGRGQGWSGTARDRTGGHWG